MKSLDYDSSARLGAILFRPLSVWDSMVAAALSAIPLLWLWWVMVHGMPIDFWWLPTDSPVMALSHAVNIDFWLNEPGRRAVTMPQWFQPGMIYQLVSFAVYRATIPGGTPLERFDSVIVDPEPFWAVLQMVPITFTLLCVLALWLAGRSLGLIAGIVTVAVFFVATPTLRFSIYDFFNESVSLSMAVAFFLLAPAALAAQPAHRTRIMVQFGVVGGLLYLLKMNYVLWALAAVPAYATAAWLGRIAWREAAIRVGIFLVTLSLTVVVLGRLLLGSRYGLMEMFKAHLSIISHSGRYGGGAKSIIDWAAIAEAASALWSGEPYLVCAVALSVLIGLAAATLHIQDRQWLRDHLPEAVLLFGAALGMTLAILKHYVPYYIVSIVAVLPFVVLWQARAAGRWTVLLLVPVIVAGISAAAHLQLNERAKEAVYALETREDVARIHSMPIAPGKARLWTYRIITPEYQRNFLIDFSSMSKLLPRVIALQGPEYGISPWHDGVLFGAKWVKLAEVPWQYIVLDKDGERYLNRDIHKWADDPTVRRTELKRLIVFERP